jgi:D-3-phosphoglycerate dehydrogenase / 2-oxoglutarate reductase
VIGDSRVKVALLNGRLAPHWADAISADRGWRFERVGNVASTLSEMPASRRALVTAIVVETEPISYQTIAACPGLELIGCLRSEPVNIDVQAASAQGVAVVYTPGRNAEAVADFTLGLCLAMLRNIAIGHDGIVSGRLTAAEEKQTGPEVRDVIWRAGGAAEIPATLLRGRELSGLVFAVVGYGVVGQAVARRMSAVVREVVATDPAFDIGTEVHAGVKIVPLEECLTRADVISLHARSAVQIVGMDELVRMRRGAYLINTARATVLDYDALVDVLDSGHLGGAAIDVYPEEPLPKTSRLLKAPRLTMTPHLAGASVEVAERQSEILGRGVRELYNGRRPWADLPVKDPQVASRWRGGTKRNISREEATSAPRGSGPSASSWEGTDNEKTEVQGH